ncbi:MAG: methyltransferase domain-containing protein [Methanomassiliicoccaceae archaeon]|jgi:ubiquinone/menaquinone biosynthesis C-methylase UbiE|nr:methyltransferase domain-containing protein [Methanomassiliicoccaceae archaeon]
MMPSQKDAWNELYRSQSRPWKGVVTTKTQFPFAKGDKILDLGCGNGKTSLALIEEGYDVTGADISEAAVETCMKLYGSRMRTICASASSMPLNDMEMDGAVMIHILEHLDNDELNAAVKELHRILKGDAKVFVRVFHKDDMRSDKGERIDENTVVRGNGIRYRYFTEDDLRNAFSGFHETSMIRVNERTKFNENRSRIEAVFERPA